MQKEIHLIHLIRENIQILKHSKLSDVCEIPLTYFRYPIDYSAYGKLKAKGARMTGVPFIYYRAKYGSRNNGGWKITLTDHSSLFQAQDTPTMHPGRWREEYICTEVHPASHWQVGQIRVDHVSLVWFAQREAMLSESFTILNPVRSWENAVARLIPLS